MALFGIESPGLTSSLAIGEEVAARLTAGDPGDALGEAELQGVELSAESPTRSAPHLIVRRPTPYKPPLPHAPTSGEPRRRLGSSDG